MRRIAPLLLGLACAVMWDGGCIPYLCQTDADCQATTPTRPFCHLARCKACFEDRHCKSGQLCDKEVCIPNKGCASHADCPSAQRCIAQSCRTPHEPPPREPPHELPPDGPTGDAPAKDAGDGDPGPCPAQCQTDDQCPKSVCGSRLHCIEGRCVESKCPSSCRSDKDCGQCVRGGERAEVCLGGGTAATGQCVPPRCPGSCTEDQHCARCPADRRACLHAPHCDPAPPDPPDPGQCGDPSCRRHGCCDDSDCGGCPNGEIYCDNGGDPSSAGSCTKVKCPDGSNLQCSSDSDCASCDQGDICDTSSGTCQGWKPCTSDAQCAKRPGQEHLPRCHPQTKNCVACLTDADCKNRNYKRCETSTGICRGCLSDADCDVSKGQECYKATKRCHFKEGQICRHADAPTVSCIPGTSCVLLYPGFSKLPYYCLRACNLGQSRACPDPKMACIHTPSHSLNRGHCLPTTCDDCPPFGAPFTCRMQSAQQPNICYPSQPSGSKGFGELCKEALSPADACKSQLFCLKHPNRSLGYCARPCGGDADCDRLGKSSTSCIELMGKMRVCALPCVQANQCPSGFLCQSFFAKKICLP